MNVHLARIFLLVLIACAAPPGFAQGGGEGANASLSFSPATPEPGDAVRVLYRPSQEMASQPAVHLRARLSTATTVAYSIESRTRTLARLEPDGSGAYSGQFVLPDTVVYALFAVSSAAGDRVDTNSRKGWPLHAHGPDGVPLYAALEQHAEDAAELDSRDGLAVARRLVEVYPDDPGAWATLASYEARSPDTDEDRTSALVDRMAAFDRSLRAEAAPDPARAYGLYRLATVLGANGGGDLSDYWGNWLVEHAPRYTETVGIRAFRTYFELHSDPQAQLAAYDRLWREAGPGGQLLELGFSTALEVEDVEAARTWAERFVEDIPWTEERVARQLGRLPATREESVRRLRVVLDRVLSRPLNRRGLFQTVDEHAPALQEEASWTEIALGQALLASGEAEASLAPLRSGAAASGTSEGYVLLAQARLATGDALGAARALAYVAASGADGADEAEDQGRDLVTAEAWDGLVAAAQRALVARAIQQAGDAPLPDDVALAGPDGERTTLNALVAGTPALVALHSRSCGFCVRDMPRLDALRRTLEADGVRVVVVTRDALDPAVAAFFEEQGYVGPLHYDTGGEVAAAFQTQVVPRYFVLDADGRVRFPFTSLDKVPRQIEALRSL